MKRYCMIIASLFGAGLFFGCMHECTCITSNDITLAGQHRFYSDTVLLDSRGDCSLMNEDSIYYITQCDSLGVVDTNGLAHQITICE